MERASDKQPIRFEDGTRLEVPGEVLTHFQKKLLGELNAALDRLHSLHLENEEDIGDLFAA